ncbi:MAG: Mrp/NBP35 family ATP-binding protein [Verrucomicrobiota bacterium]
MPDENAVRETLAEVKYPGFSRDIVSFGLVKEIKIEGSSVEVEFSFATRDPKVPQQIYKDARAALEAMDGVEDVHLEFDIKDPPQQQQPPAAGGEGGVMADAKIPGVKHIIAVGSGKGGVGKSTVAANLAVALQKTGARVGLCDCDLYGPSVALMFGSTDQPMVNDVEQIIPIRAHGLQLMSMGFMLGDDSPVIVRGPMATRYTQQFLRNVAWDQLDYLILDLPPGTGDIQLTIVQTASLTGALIVTTPQEVALIDARKAVAMFGKVNVEVLGIIENMSYFLCPSDGERYDIFGTGGGKAEAEKLGVPLLGEIPIDMETRQAGDDGEPIAIRDEEESATSRVFAEIAQKLIARVDA